MRTLMFVLSVIAVMSLISCSSSEKVGSEKIVDKSGSTPDWIKTPTSDDSEFVYVTGEITKANDRSFGMNQAYADGVRKLMNTMQNDVKTQSTQALRGANLSDGDVGRFSEFAVAWISDTYKVSGVQNPESYWEKVEVKTISGVKYNYNSYSLLKISKQDYNRALEGAFYELQRKAQEENNKKAEESATKLLDELK